MMLRIKKGIRPFAAAALAIGMCLGTAAVANAEIPLSD